MTTRQLLSASQLAVTIEDAKLSLRIDNDDLDRIVEIWLRGVIGRAEFLMQRSIIHQTWLDTADAFPVSNCGGPGAIKLRYPPVVEVLWIKYYDQANTLVTLHPDDYVVDTVSEPGWVVPAPGKSWPSTFDRINAVQVAFKCGYGPDAETTPDDIKLFITAKLVEQFDQNGTPPKNGMSRTFIDTLLDRFVVYA
jgi:uncharacterized phiE125 gp8 family phage protein